MQVIVNANHVQSNTISGTEEFFNIIQVDTFREGLLQIEDEPTVLAGFIYDDKIFKDAVIQDPSILMNIEDNDILYVSDVGVLPNPFVTVEEDKKYYSLLQQIVELSNEDIPESIVRDSKDLTRYYNFQDFEDVFDLNRIYKKKLTQ
ncbi:hypothetical protein FMLHJGGC_00261 [Staphylococcus phage BSwM-KMM1]|nr:hypothetical protein FMLHJGGC_00261 [Pseudomonas phage BSwM KMM1]